MNKYRIERLSSSNIGFLDILYQKVYGKRQAAGYFSRKYNTAYTGAGYIGYFAFAGTEPVSFFGVIPVLMSVAKEKVLAAQPSDAMTVSKYRQEGLFTELGNLTFELARLEGIHFIAGFPNQDSFQVSIKNHGFIHLHTMNRYVINYGDQFYKRIIRKVKTTGRRQPGENFTNSMLAGGYDGVIYDPNYIRYKTFNGNYFAGNDNNRSWLRHRRHVLAGAFSAGALQDLNSEIRNLATKLHAASITVITSPDTVVDRKIGVISGATPAFHVIVKDLTMKYPYANLKFQMADMDVF